MFSYAILESLQLRRDPIRLAMSLFGTLLLMFVIGYGMNMDIDELDFAVLDRDQTSVSRDYIADLSGSRYFTAQAPISDYDEMDRRMREGDLALAIEIPPGFASDMMRGRDIEIGAWIDGSNPTRAETVRAYVQGIHANWLTRLNRERYGDNATAGDFSIETRYRYNPDIKSIIAIAPAIMPLLLLMIPAMLTSLAVVREKELGSIINLYVTPVTRLEFLIGKQLPYVALAMLNFIMLTAFIVFIFRVPFSGSFLTFALFALVYVTATTAIGLLISTFISTQIAAIFGALYRRDLSRHPFHHRLARQLFQGTGFGRSGQFADAAADRCAVTDRGQHDPFEKAGEISHGSGKHLPSGHQGTARPAA
jgi:ribosome-dependent ATPase